MDFSTGPPSKGGPDIDRQLQAARQQFEMQQRLKSLQKMAEKCFSKCVTKPGSSLDSYTKKCLDYCMDRYSDTEKLVSQTLVTRLQDQQ